MIVLFLLLALVLAAIWQRDNLKAMWILLTKDEEAISAQLDEKREAVEKDLEEKTGVVIQIPTAQQRSELLSGEKTAEEILEELDLADFQLPPLSSDPASEASVQTPQNPTVPEIPQESVTQEDLIRACAMEMASCEIDIIGKLSAMRQAAYDEWHALEPEERTEKKKTEIAMAGMKKCYQMEAGVDQQVRAIINKYKAEIRKIGGDPSVLNPLWQYYIDEKATQKAFYTNQYLK